MIDGNLDEPEWSKALILKDFKQLQPNLGEPTTQNAITKILYDEKYLYVAVVMKYDNPSEMYGITLERDNSLLRDDYIEFHLDTYNDNTNTLVFRTNIHGSREDYEVSRNGESINTSWNTFWDVSTQTHHNYWVAEFRIPFTSLRFEENDVNTMRFKTALFYKLKNELIISTLNEIKRTPQVYQYKNSKEIHFNNLVSESPLYITPYIKANYQSNSTLNEEGNRYIRDQYFMRQNGFVDNETLDKILSNTGLDVKYKIHSNHTADITINPDFAEVEVDNRIINITRFPVFLPEKRLFFLENQDLFNSNQFDHRLFFSRRIGLNNGAPVPIIAGGRYTGSSSNWSYGALSMQTNENEFEELPSYNMSVARAKYSIGDKGSYVGFLTTSKVSANDYNYLTAIDASIRIKDNLLTRFMVGSTFDKEKGDWKLAYGAYVNTFKANGFGINYRYREYDEDFNPELGFVSRPNTKRLTLNHGWRKTFVNNDLLRNISLGNWTTKSRLSSNGNSDYMQSNMYSFLTFTNGMRVGLLGPIYQEDNLYSRWDITDTVSILPGKYGMWKINPSFSTGNAFPYSFSLETELGDYYEGKQFTLSSSISYDFNTTFSAELGGNYNQLKLPKGFTNNNTSTLLKNRFYTKLKLSFSPRAFLNSYIQYDSNSDTLGWNLRYRFTPQEGTNLFLVYNQNINTDRDIGTPRLPFSESQSLIFKYSKTFIK